MGQKILLDIGQFFMPKRLLAIANNRFGWGQVFGAIWQGVLTVLESSGNLKEYAWS